MAIVDRIASPVIGELSQQENNQSKNINFTNDNNDIKKGFLRSLSSELGQVKWPSLRYVMNWSLTIIIFTAIFSLSLGFIDNVFGRFIILTDCSSQVVKNTTNDNIQTCLKTFTENAFFIKF
jgi:preprotein translocase SecE subunit